MKHIFIYFIIVIFINTYSVWVYANNNKINNISNTYNTDLNIKWAKLIKKYLNKLKENLKNIKIKYKLKENLQIKKYEKDLSTMIKLLSKIENKKIKKDKAENIMRIIIKELKPLNEKIKNLLKRKKEENLQIDNKIKEKFYTLSIKLSNTLNKIILNYYIPIKNKKNIIGKDKVLLLELKNLKINSDKLKNLKNKNLQSIDNIKEELLIILRSIKSSLIIIKNND